MLTDVWHVVALLLNEHTILRTTYGVQQLSPRLVGFRGSCYNYTEATNGPYR